MKSFANLTSKSAPRLGQGGQIAAASKSFLRAETGAVTLDYVVLTAGIVGLGIAVASAVSPGVDVGAEQIRATLFAAAPFDVRAAFDPATGTFTMNGVSGTYVHGGGDRYAINELGIEPKEGSDNNGTHGFDFDEPVSSANFVFTSIHGANRLGQFRATLEDGSQVDIPFDTFTNGGNYYDIDAGEGNFRPLEAEYDINGQTYYSAGRDQAAFVVHLNEETVAGMSAQNQIVGFSYDQQSTMSTTTGYAYNVHLEGKS